LVPFLLHPYSSISVPSRFFPSSNPCLMQESPIPVGHVVSPQLFPFPIIPSFPFFLPEPVTGPFSSFFFPPLFFSGCLFSFLALCVCGTLFSPSRQPLWQCFLPPLLCFSPPFTFRAHFRGAVYPPPPLLFPPSSLPRASPCRCFFLHRRCILRSYPCVPLLCHLPIRGPFYPRTLHNGVQLVPPYSPALDSIPCPPSRHLNYQSRSFQSS